MNWPQEAAEAPVSELTWRVFSTESEGFTNFSFLFHSVFFLFSEEVKSQRPPDERRDEINIKDKFTHTAMLAKINTALRSLPTVVIGNHKLSCWLDERWCSSSASLLLQRWPFPLNFIFKSFFQLSSDFFLLLSFLIPSTFLSSPLFSSLYHTLVNQTPSCCCFF